MATGQGTPRIAGMCVLSCFTPVRLFATRWTLAHQALLSMEFSRQEYWGGCLALLRGDLPYPGTEPASSAGSELQAGSLLLSHPGSPRIAGNSPQHKRIRKGSSLGPLEGTWSSQRLPF